MIIIIRRVVSTEKANEKKKDLNLDLFFEISSKERTHIDEVHIYIFL